MDPVGPRAPAVRPALAETESGAEAFWATGTGQGMISAEALPAPGPDDVLVRTLCSGVSRGTGTLVFVPESEYQRMRAPFQVGDFPGPAKYGYISVALVEAGPKALVGRTVFCLHPHQTRYVVPADADDARMRDLVYRHQGTDKGFGPALGPFAWAAAQATLADFGYRVDSAPSDWRLGPGHRALQEALVEGWAAAATEVAAEQAEPLREWADFRQLCIARSRSWLEVGHRDILGWRP